MEQETAAALKPWDKLEGETGAAYSAFVVYRELGTTRNLSAAYKMHLDSRDAAPEVSPRRVRKGSKSVPSETKPTTGLVASGRWKQWASKFSWKERAEAYDRHLAGIRLAEQEKRAKTFSATYAEKQEEFLLGMLNLKILLLTGAQELMAKGKLIERTIRRVARDAQGEPIQQEERFSMAEQLDKLFALDKYLSSQVVGSDRSTAEAGGEETGEDSWVTRRLRQIQSQGGGDSDTSPSPAKTDSTLESAPGTKDSPGR